MFWLFAAGVVAGIVLTGFIITGWVMSSARVIERSHSPHVRYTPGVSGGKHLSVSGSPPMARRGQNAYRRGNHANPGAT